MSSAPLLSPALSTSYAQRVAFVAEIAGRLHTYGTTAQRLEASLVALSQQLDWIVNHGPIQRVSFSALVIQPRQSVQVILPA